MSMTSEIGLVIFENNLRDAQRQVAYKENAWALTLLAGYCATLSKNGLHLNSDADVGLRGKVVKTLSDILTRPPARKDRNKPLKTADIVEVVELVPETASMVLRENPHRINLTDTPSLRRIATIMPKEDAEREALSANGRIYTGRAFVVPTKIDGTKYVPMAIMNSNGYVDYIFDNFTGEKAHILRTLERINTLAHCTKGVFDEFTKRSETAFATAPR
jgi:hypothetical protein